MAVALVVGAVACSRNQDTGSAAVVDTTKYVPDTSAQRPYKPADTLIQQRPDTSGLRDTTGSKDSLRAPYDTSKMRPDTAMVPKRDSVPSERPSNVP